MKKYILFISIALFLIHGTNGQENEKLILPKETTALLIIDVQMFYFPEGQVPLVHPVETSKKIQKLLEGFRANKMEVIHIKHDASKNASIHPNVKPQKKEKVFIKNEANSFNGTDLSDYLKTKGITHLVITGMQTHMCVEATTRTAYDLGYKCIVPEETATTRDLKYNGYVIEARDVHMSTLSSLANSYAKVVKLNTVLNSL